MAKLPRKPPAQRSAEPAAEAVVSRPLFRRYDRRQPDLFRPLPAFVAPCRPVLRDRLPAGPLWSYEVKHDGYRIQAHAVGDEVRLFSKSGRDYTDRLPGIRTAVGRLGRDVVLDGEAVRLAADGTTDFFGLHAAVAFGSAPTAFLVAFDILSLDGQDLRALPHVERREKLAQALADCAGIEMAEPLSGDPATILREACALGLEGIVAKRTDRPYRSGDRDDWIKVKCTSVEPFAVIGFDPAPGKGVASLRLARLDPNGHLRGCGWVGSGIGETASRELRAALDAGVHVVVDVEHRGTTPADELRHPVFRGWHRES